MIGDRVLVLAPHPDDECLGAGGTIARCVKNGAEVTVAIATVGTEPMFSKESVAQVRAEAEAAHKILGVSKTVYLDFPAVQLDTVPNYQLNTSMQGLLVDLCPETLILPFPGDIHADHKVVFDAAMVAARPKQEQFPRLILAYETLSETNWNAPFLTPGFTPNYFVDISDDLEAKQKALAEFKSQMQAFPSERSLESIVSLAKLRGSTVYCEAAEAFVLVRQVVS